MKQFIKTSVAVSLSLALSLSGAFSPWFSSFNSVLAETGSGPDLGMNYQVGNESNPGAGFGKTTTANIGDFVDFYFEVQNVSVPSDASNFNIKAYVPNFIGGAVTSNASASTTTSCSLSNCHTNVSDSVTVNIPANGRLVYQSGTVRVTADLDQDGTKELNGATISDDVVTGANGFTLGTLKGGTTTVQVSFTAVVASLANPNLTARLITNNLSRSGTAWGKSTDASSGENVKFHLELHNTQVGSAAHNVKIKATIPGDFANSSVVKIDVTADNGGPVSDTATVNFPRASKLGFTSGSTLLIWDSNGDGVKEYNNTPWANNDLVGNGIILNSDLNGTNEFILELSFNATVSEPPVVETSPNCSVTKKIRLPNGSEVTSVSASDHVYSPGEEIVYRLFISNSGTGDASNFSISDFLPTYIFWVSGDGGYASGENKVNFDLGTLKAKESRTLTYKAKVRDNIPSGQVSQTNNAKVNSPSNLTCTTSSTLTIGKPGAILAATALPQTGAIPGSVLATLGLVATGIIARLRKIKTTRWGR